MSQMMPNVIGSCHETLPNIWWHPKKRPQKMVELARRYKVYKCCPDLAD
jgi:hypothetical protein